MPAIANWLLQNCFTYENICAFSIQMLIVFCFLALRKQKSAQTHDRVLGFFIHPITFISVMTLCIVLHRLPFLYINEPLNIDEAQALAGAMKFKVDWAPWRSVDHNTVGPFISWLLNLLNSIGLPLNYHTARVAGLICLTTQWTLTYLSLRLITTEALSRIFTCTGVVFSAYSSLFDWLHYSSEQLPNAVLAGIWYCGVQWIVCKKFRYALVSMALLGWLPWIKIQYAPFTILLAPLLIAGLIYEEQKLFIKNAGRALLALAAPTIIMFILLLFTGSLVDFIQSYLLSNVEYATMHNRIANAQSLIMSWLTIPSSMALTYPLAVWTLIGTTSLIIQPQLASRRVKIFYVLFLIGITASILSISIPGHEFLHYLLIIALVQTIVTGLFCGAIIQEFLNGRPRFFAECAACVAIGVTTIYPQYLVSVHANTNFWAEQIQRTNQSSQITSELIKKYGRKPLAIWGWRPDLFIKLESVPATRDMCTYYAIKSSRRSSYYQNRFLADLKTSNPPVFIDAVSPNSFYFTDQKTEGHEIFKALATYIATNYVWVDTVSGMRIYNLKSLGSAGETEK